MRCFAVVELVETTIDVPSTGSGTAAGSGTTTDGNQFWIVTFLVVELVETT